MAIPWAWARRSIEHQEKRIRWVAHKDSTYIQPTDSRRNDCRLYPAIFAVCYDAHAPAPCRAPCVVVKSYCQTLENRSSLAPNPPAGLGGAIPAVVPVLPELPVLPVLPVLLDQPPNSSSAATFGAVPNPDAPGTMLWLAID